MHIRELTTIQDLEATIPLQKAIWRFDDADALAAHTLKVYTHVGGVVLGAYDDNRLIGFVAALPTRHGALWSDVTGVHPDYQRRGVGVALKHYQREWALKHGFSEIRWTFDPLQRGNANLNFHILSATSNTYHTSFYGAMTDGINTGMRSDRLEAVWKLHVPRLPVDRALAESAPFLLAQAGANFYTAAPDNAPLYRVEIPYDIGALKNTDIAHAQTWQTHFAEVMMSAFSAGYSTADFITERESRRCWHVLRRP